MHRTPLGSIFSQTSMVSSCETMTTPLKKYDILVAYADSQLHGSGSDRPVVICFLVSGGPFKECYIVLNPRCYADFFRNLLPVRIHLLPLIMAIRGLTHELLMIKSVGTRLLPIFR